MLDLLLYRLFRLRRTIIAGILPCLATVLIVSSRTGQTHELLVLLAIALPTTHVVLYPNNWSETLAVSVSLSLGLGLAATIPADMGGIGLLFRLALLLLLTASAFLLLVVPFSLLAMAGPLREFRGAATRVSRLSADELRAAVTLYPGRQSTRLICGAPDEDGIFPVHMHIRMDPLTFETAKDCTPDIEHEIRASIASSGPDHHHVFFADGDRIGATRHTFEAHGAETRVTMWESGGEMALGEHLGMWLTDYLADYLTDEIDRAEQRAPRANRAFAHKQLVVDMANFLVPLLGATGGKTL